MNEHADNLYGSETAKEEVKEKQDLEIEDELTKEMESLRKKSEKPISERRFQSVATGVKGCLFIRTTVRLYTSHAIS